MIEIKTQENLEMIRSCYELFDFDSYNFSISTIEAENNLTSLKFSTDYLIKKYSKIANEFNNKIIVIKNEEDVNKLLLETIKQQYLMVQNEKFFQNVTCIVDFVGDNQDEKNKMFIALSGLSNHLMKKTSIKLHMILEEKDIMKMVVGSSLWDYRSHTFRYISDEVNKVILFEELNETVKEKSFSKSKNKL